MINYEKIKDKERTLKALTSLSKEEFECLLIPFKKEWEDYSKTNFINNSGQNPRLIKLEDKYILLLGSVHILSEYEYICLGWKFLIKYLFNFEAPPIIFLEVAYLDNSHIFSIFFEPIIILGFENVISPINSLL